MNNALTFTKNDDSLLKSKLEALEENLNTSIADINYSFFVLEKIINESNNLKIKRNARKFMDKQILAQDELDYLNSCIVFLKRQIDKTLSFHTLNREEISARINQLTNDIEVFIEVQIVNQKAYFEFANKHLKAITTAA